MKQNLRLWALCVLVGMSGACGAAESSTVTNSASTGDVAGYQTELFNLLINKESLVDGKNHYQKEFASAFDAMLATSALAREARSAVSLKRRLLSGPQPQGTLVSERVSGRSYFYYEACQAHACDETKLALLYSPSAKAMFGRLRLNGKVEYLGHPALAEKTLLDQTTTAP